MRRASSLLGRIDGSDQWKHARLKAEAVWQPYNGAGSRAYFTLMLACAGDGSATSNPSGRVAFPAEWGSRTYANDRCRNDLTLAGFGDRVQRPKASDIPFERPGTALFGAS